jgi:hypothetical protein
MVAAVWDEIVFLIVAERLCDVRGSVQRGSRGATILAVVPLVVLSACVAPSKRVAMTEPEQEIAFESNPALARFWGDEATLSYAV